MCLSNTVKFFAHFSFITLCIASLNALACGPSPQKVIREITIKADIQDVWALLGNFEGMHLWHPHVKSTSIVVKKDANGQLTRYRRLTLNTGKKMLERLREGGIGTATQKMKIGTYMESGDIPVSNYSNVISVTPGLVKNETKVIWIARFNNKANLMQAPAGEDDATAIAAIEAFYDAGLSALKQRLDTQATSKK